MPGGQGWQDVEFRKENVPGWQMRGSSPNLQAIPGGHTTELFVEPIGQKTLSLQKVQPTDPVRGAYVPLLHLVHSVREKDDPYDPVGQAVQFVIPYSVDIVPSAHGKHVPPALNDDVPGLQGRSFSLSQE